MKTKKSCFDTHRSNARARGVEFQFTYDEWIAWWEARLGPNWIEKRGCKKGQYVMARYGDNGPYNPTNTKVLLAEDNHREYNTRRVPSRGWSHAMLPDEVVLAIYVSDLPYQEIVDELGDEFGVTKHKIQCIKTKRYFKKKTDEFERKRSDEIQKTTKKILL